MGSFIGHAIPGSFFMLAAAWWIIRALITYYKSFGRQGKSTFRCTVTNSPRLRCCPNLDIEALMFTVAAAIGIFVEIIAACYMRHLPVHIGNRQHATMYFFFGLAGFICLLSPTLKRVIPEIENVKYVMMLMAYIVEAILFKFHLMGRDNVDILVHTLLLYTVYGAIISVCLEMCMRENILCVLARGLTTWIQGTWFWHVGFILYDPFGSPEWVESHDTMMMIPLLFSWHIGITLVLMLVLAAVTASYYRAKGLITATHFPLNSNNSSTNGYRKLNSEFESETLIGD